MSIEDYFFTIYFPGFVCFVLYYAKISGERLLDHWSSGFCFISFHMHVRIKTNQLTKLINLHDMKLM